MRKINEAKKPSMDPDVLARFTGDTPAPGTLYRPWDIDHIHITRKVRCVPETAEYLYGGFTSCEVAYVKGSRPELEWHVAVALKNAKTDAERAEALMHHVFRVVLHTAYVPQELHELGGTEERILQRGFGYCNEQARVLVAMAQIAGIPARLAFVCQPNGGRHVLAEMYVNGAWGFFDATGDICGPVGDAFASALDIQQNRDMRNSLDVIASGTKTCMELLCKNGTLLYSDYFSAFSLVNYPLSDFPYSVLRP